MLTKSVTINFNTGDDLAIGSLVNIANNFNSIISIEYNNILANCKSIMGMLALNLNDEKIIKITVEGNDEQEAFDSIVNFIEGKK